MKSKTKSPKPRAKMYLRAKLGWLWGYPLATENQSIQWQQLHYPMPWDMASLTISHQQVATASVSRNKLLSDFPHILPSLVGDKADWSTLLTLKLQALRAMLEGEAIDPVTALLTAEVKNGGRLQHKVKELYDLYPTLRCIVEGFIWWLNLDGKTLMLGLQWIEQNNAALHVVVAHETDGIPTDTVRNAAIMFTLAQQTSGRSATYLLDLAAHPIWEDDNLRGKQRWFDEFYGLWLTCDNAYETDRLLSFTAKAINPSATGGRMMTNDFWLRWGESLLLKSRRERTQYLAVLQHLLPLELLDSWLALKQDLYQKIALITQILQDTQQQLAIVDQQSKLISIRYMKLNARLLKHPGSGKLEREFPKRELVEQHQQYEEQQTSLQQESGRLLKSLSSQLEFLGIAPATSTSNTSQKLSYLPSQKDFNWLFDFGLQNRSRLQQLQTVLRRLQVHHEWQGVDCLLRLLHHWQYIRYLNYGEFDSLSPMMDSVLVYLRQAGNEDLLNRRLLPWNNLLTQKQQDSRIGFEIFDFAIGVNDQCFDERDTFLKLLGELCESHIVLSKTAVDFRRFWYKTPRHWPHIAYFTALQNHDIQLHDELNQQDFRDIDRLLDSDYCPENFLALIKTWQLHQTDEDSDAAYLSSPDDNGNIFAALTAAARLITNNYPEVVHYFKDQQQWQALAALKPVIEQYEKLTKTTCTPPTRPKPQSNKVESNWQQHYPAALQAALRTLQQYHPQTEKAATSILSSHFPHPKTLQQEITALQQRIPLTQDQAQQQAMLKRCANLQQRLEHPISVSAQQLEKLQQKLRHAAYTQLLDNWKAHCHETFLHHLKEHLGLPHFPADWLQDKRKLRSLVALTELGTAEQKIAGLLLQAHIAGVDQDLRDQPANRQWLENMERSGIPMQAWLSNAVFELTVEVGSKKAITLQLRFADDIFDILQMGDHFNTCLSHDDFNFFSVVANAADLNKRVVYAYDTTGRIQGRCLLGISREKYLVAFHPYSHLSNDAFKEALSAFISKLEQEMGIHRSHEGTVPLLLARDWYDDGVETIMPDYGALKPNSAFRQQLENLPARQLLSAFQQTIAPHALNDFALLRLLRLKFLNKRPEYLFALYHQTQQAGVATTRTNTAIVDSLLKKQEVPHEQIWPLAKDWIYDFLFTGSKLDNEYSPAWMDLLLSQNPNLVLRLTRALSSLSNTPGYYFSSDFYVYQARALLAIHRPGKAIATYQKAIATDENGYHNLYDFTPGEVQQEMDACLALSESN